MPQKSLVIPILTIALIGGIVVWAALRPAPAGAPTPSQNIAPVALPEGKYEEHAAYYDIVANYATSTPFAGAANTSATELMRGFVASTIGQFKADGNFDHLSPEDIKMLGFDQGRTYTLNITYLMASSEHTRSYIFTIYEDTGGAHGNTFFKTFVFDAATGVPLQLSDVFQNGTAYLSLLSQISRAKLPKVIGESADTLFIKDGTAADPKNFQNFFFDRTNFVLLFPPYQVASYAAGPQTLYIPTDQLSSVLKSEYRY